MQRAVRSDFALIGAYTLLFISVGATLILDGNWYGWAVVGLGLLAGVCDVMENVAMFDLIGRPCLQTFAQWRNLTLCGGSE